MDELCLGDDARRFGNSSISVDQENCINQANIITSYLVTSTGVSCFICGWESGELRVYTWSVGKRDDGFGFGEHAHWVVDVARVTTPIGVAFLACALEVIDDGGFAKVSQFQ